MHAAKRRTTRMLALLAALTVCAAAGASPAVATTVSYCNQNISAYTICPNNTGSGHPRHTYKDNYGQWGTSPHYGGCPIVVRSEVYVAYTNGIASSWKYFADGCNYVYHSFPNNTELLRPYVAHTNYPYNNYLHGDAVY